ncbi:alpha/beta fold hydrolase [Amycolatopsis magusensis]|uniref:Pimeloyl-ACP methyl ester carboxylesterase n=1 Tax=Amycolatopsis magusensis TaxID=882444 RepID=A0ABS4PXQ2_9PSEU|nr:alpha/beta hydrolase [Amycolatopsis magusensis]MBP2183356.1 pimeloyl-ACP methyl ester carboxylesterase [Amycolatopsis magusensis]
MTCETGRPPLGRHHEVGGRKLAVYRSGEGGPAVVFLPGAGLVGLEFLNVHERAAELTTSVLYDRGGTGWSEAVELPRSAEEVATELRDLLRTAEIPAPYVLAGHSLGAFYARRYAQLFPGEVAGLLLLDPGHEDIFDYLPAEAAELNEEMSSDIPELTAEQLEQSRTALAELYAEWPRAVLEPLIENRLALWRTGLTETANFESELYGELRAGGALPDVPLIVFTAMGRNPYWAQFASEELDQKLHEGLHAMHAAMAASVPRGEHRTLDDAPHQYLQVKHADALAEAIGDLVGNSRRRGTGAGIDNLEV